LWNFTLYSVCKGILKTLQANL